MQKLVTKAIETALAKTPYGTQDGVPLRDKKIIARYFNPYGHGTWYVLEDSSFKDDRIVFGAVDMGCGLELGGFSIAEIETTRIHVSMFGMSADLPLERDIGVEPLKSTMGEYIDRYGHQV